MSARAAILERARSAIGHGTVYALGRGRGGRDPLTPSPADKLRRCDCSGFAAWACGLDRYQPASWLKQVNGGWLSTNGIISDAMATPHAFFRRVAVPELGDLVVYGDRKVNGVTRQGHVGIVAEFPDLRVVHCSSSNYKRTGDAIQETDGAFFLARGAIFARYIPRAA